MRSITWIRNSELGTQIPALRLAGMARRMGGALCLVLAILSLASGEDSECSSDDGTCVETNGGAGTAVEARVEQLSRAGRSLSKSRDYGAAVRAYRRALGEILPSIGLDTCPPGLAALALVSGAELAEAEILAAEYDAALRTLGFVQRAAVRHLPAGSAREDSVRTLQLIESRAHECKGDVVTALARFEGAQGGNRGRQTLSDLRRHHSLLEAVLGDERRNMPDGIRALMVRKQDHLASELLRLGPWVSVWQLPDTYIAGLEPSQPVWPSPPIPGDAVRIIEESAPKLADEYRTLKKEGALRRETECIADGDWFKFEVTAQWNSLDPSTRCSVHTPAACRLVRTLGGLGKGTDSKGSSFLVLRAGYSVVGPSTWLRPHFGVSNGQLKLHLGVVVPQGGSGKPCATLRIQNETRVWEIGRVLAFDDSFKHEVRNRCAAERVIFQIVVTHPEALKEAGRARGAL